MMYDNDIYARRHRGSSPPFLNSEIKLEEWMKSCRSIDQHPYNSSDIDMLRQCAVPKIEFSETKINSENSFDEGSSDKNLV